MPMCTCSAKVGAGPTLLRCSHSACPHTRCVREFAAVPSASGGVFCDEAGAVQAIWASYAWGTTTTQYGAFHSMRVWSSGFAWEPESVTLRVTLRVSAVPGMPVRCIKDVLAQLQRGEQPTVWSLETEFAPVRPHHRGLGPAYADFAVVRLILPRHRCRWLGPAWGSRLRGWSDSSGTAGRGGKCWQCGASCPGAMRSESWRRATCCWRSMVRRWSVLVTWRPPLSLPQEVVAVTCLSGWCLQLPARAVIVNQRGGLVLNATRVGVHTCVRPGWCGALKSW